MKSKIISCKRRQRIARCPITPLTFFFCFSEDALDIVEEVESQFYLLQNVFAKRYSIIYRDWRIKGAICKKNIQSVYNKLILSSNYAIFILQDEIREGTNSEFEMVYQRLTTNSRKPKILLYIKDNGKHTEALREYFKPYSKHITYLLYNNSSQIFSDIMLKVITFYYNESTRYNRMKVESRSALINERLKILEQEHKSIFANYPEKIASIENAMNQTRLRNKQIKTVDVRRRIRNIKKSHLINLRVHI